MDDINGFVVQQFEVRTAFNPEGTGETFDIIQRIGTTGLSAEILPDSRQDHGSTTVVGANWRHYWERTFSLEGDQDTGDLGMNVGWRCELEESLDFHADCWGDYDERLRVVGEISSV